MEATVAKTVCALLFLGIFFYFFAWIFTNIVIVTLIEHKFPKSQPMIKSGNLTVIMTKLKYNFNQLLLEHHQEKGLSRGIEDSL